MTLYGMGSFVSFKDVHRTACPNFSTFWSDIVLKYHWRAWLEALIEIDKILYPLSFKSDSGLDIQIEIVNKIVPPALRPHVELLLRNGSRISVCFPAQIEALQSLILGWCEEGLEKLPLAVLFDALLLTSENLVSDAPYRYDIKESRSTTKNKLDKYFRRLGLMQYEENASYYWLRWHYIYLIGITSTSKKTLVDMYPNLSQIIGMSLDHWLALGFFFKTFWVPNFFKKHGIYRTNADIVYLFPKLSSDISIMLQQLSATKEIFKEAVRRSESLLPSPHCLSLRTISSFPIFMHSPGVFVPLSLRKLFNQTSEFPMHALLKWGDENNRDVRQRFGEIYENYIGFIIDNSNCAGKVTISPEVGNNNAQLCDVAIEYGDAIVLIEAKWSQFTKQTIVSGAITDSDLRKIYVEPATQISNRIKDWFTSNLSTLSKKPCEYKIIIPLIIGFQYHPANFQLTESESNHFFRYGKMIHERVHKIQITSVTNFEPIIGALSTHNLSELILHRSSNSDLQKRALPFDQYALRVMGWKLPVGAAFRTYPDNKK